MIDRSRLRLGGLAAGVALAAFAWVGQAAYAQTPDAEPTRPVLEEEETDVAVLAPPGPRRIVVFDAYVTGGTITEGEQLNTIGMIPVARVSSFRAAPDFKTFYVAETIYSRGNRGTRQDMISVYDGLTLDLKREIPLPGRLLAVTKSTAFDINASGTRAFVYNMQPASSVIVTDLVKGKVQNVIETPGCAMVLAFGDGGFASPCGDGSLLSVAVDAAGKAKLTRTEPFFDANLDPIVDENVVDRATGKAFLISYTGLVYPAQLGATSQVEAPFSIQEGANLPRPKPDVSELAWRPGGSRFAAYHPQSGRLFVLMHRGVHWSHKDPGEEVWVVDTTTRKVVKRIKLAAPAMNVAVSPDATPLIYVSGDAGTRTLDSSTGREIARAGHMRGQIHAPVR